MALIATIDLETTGRSRKHGIHQIGLHIEKEGSDGPFFSVQYNVQPLINSLIDDQALKICNVTREKLGSYPPSYMVFLQIKEVLDSIVDINDPATRIFISGFNCEAFDCPMFDEWWKFHAGQKASIYDYFFRGSFDVFLMASYALRKERPSFTSFSLSALCTYYKIPIDETKLHTAIYDCHLTSLLRKMLQHE